MPYQIDQSGRLEFTSQDTVIALSNGDRFAVLIKAKDKRYLQSVFRTMGRNKQFAIHTFAIMVYLLIHTRPSSPLTIDSEYPGWDETILSLIANLFKRHGKVFNPNLIEFKPIGKRSEAHWHAYYVYKKKRRPTLTVTAKEILNELYQ